MVTVYFIAAMLALPPWASDAELRPKRTKSVEVSGPDAPEELVLMPPRKFSSITLQGPGKVELRLHGLTVRKGKRKLGPGAVQVKKGTSTSKSVSFSARSLPWKVKKRRRWTVSEPVVLEFELEEGPNPFSFKPSKSAKAGFLLTLRKVDAEPPVEEEPPALAEAPEPPPPPPPAPEPAPDPVPEIAPEPEPELVAGVEAAPVEGVEPGFEIQEPRPSTATIKSPDGDGFFMQLAAAEGVRIEARGTGVLVFDFHAHRNPAVPETLDPTVLAVLLDDVLVDTLRVDAPINSLYSVAGAEFDLSDRVQFQVTVPPGRHEIQVTLADTALAGGSLRARFETTDVQTVPRDDAMPLPQPPPLVDLSAAPEPDVAQPSAAWVGFTLAGGAALGNSSGQLGAGGVVDFFVMPEDFGRAFGFGATSGVTWVQTSETVGDIRAPGGTTEVTLTELSAPILVDLRVALNFDDYALFLGAGGGGLVTSAETEALGSTSSTGTEWVWAATAHLSFLGRLGDGWWTVRGQWTVSDPMNTANLRDFDPGTFTASVGYVFSND
ncbi:MAG: hypothetical protein AAF658_04955 [Myxococcota bacterium]